MPAAGAEQEIALTSLVVVLEDLTRPILIWLAPMFKDDSKSNGENLSRKVSKSPPSVIGSDLVIVGTLTSTGEVQIDGRVDGDIRAGSVVIGAQANYEGDIVAEEVSVDGRIIGTIRARKVTLASTSHVEGTILHETLAVRFGAFFEGDCRHSADPLSEAVGATDAQRPSFEARRAGAVASVVQMPGTKPAGGAVKALR